MSSKQGVDWIVKRTVVESFYVRAFTRDEAKNQAINPYDVQIKKETAVRAYGVDPREKDGD